MKGGGGGKGVDKDSIIESLWEVRPGNAGHLLQFQFLAQRVITP